MDKWKDELKQAFEAPQPVRKRNFLRQLDLPRMPVHEFLFSQIGYIRKWVWCVSALVFVVSILGLAFLPGTVLWLISGLTPLLALTIISESGRSELYKMVELEMAARFSLRSVTFARLAILGLMDLLLLGVLFPIGLWNDTAAPLAAALYMITPFLLTTFIGLYIVRKFRGQEAMYACVGISVGISISLFLSHNIIPFIYQEQCLTAWMITALVLLFGNGKQCVAMIKKTEEFAWNLS
ncbi:MAG: hypothetical protein IKL04_01430 [Lachnospiraceae bacterium]|nr:hypothetical protein [Lachnospiraceae bacterium]